MNTKWMNTNVALLSEMIDVSDEKILSASNGEVTHPAPLDEEDQYQGSMNDSAIFGALGNEDTHTLMGHIALPVPLVNIQYLYGKRPILPRILNISRSDLTKIIHYSAYVVIDPKDEGVAYKQVISPEEIDVFQQAHPGSVLMTGAEAIDALLTKDGSVEREHIILHNIPVIPISLRYKKIQCTKQGEAWMPYSIEYLYDRFIIIKNRLKRLTDLGAPEVILLNESRMYQEYADTLINNGSYGFPLITDSGCPADSLHELSEIISSVSLDMAKPDPIVPEYISVDAEKVKALAMTAYPWMQEDEYNGQEQDEDPQNDEPEIIETPYNPENEPEEVAKREIREIFQPFLDAVIQTNFPEYDKDYHHVMLQFAERSILVGIQNVDFEKPIERQLLNGIYETVRRTMNKQNAFL